MNHGLPVLVAVVRVMARRRKRMDGGKQYRLTVVVFVRRLMMQQHRLIRVFGGTEP
jgi:hypothetical protein